MRHEGVLRGLMDHRWWLILCKIIVFWICDYIRGINLKGDGQCDLRFKLWATFDTNLL